MNVRRCDSDITSVGVQVEALATGDSHNTLSRYIQIKVAAYYSVGYKRRGVELCECAGRWSGRRYAADQFSDAVSIYAAGAVERKDIGGYAGEIDCLDWWGEELLESADGADERDGHELRDVVAVDARGVYHLGWEGLCDYLASADVVGEQVVETADGADVCESDEVVCVIAVDAGDIQNHITGDIYCSSRCEEIQCSDWGGTKQIETTDQRLVDYLWEVVAVDGRHLENTWTDVVGGQGTGVELLGGAQLERLAEWNSIQLEAADQEIQIAGRSDNAGNRERTGGQLLETTDRAEIHQRADWTD